ncbi:MAG: DNA mismatch repair protein MutS, partial [Planctomycetota bacterium]
IALGRATPRDLVALARSCEAAAGLCAEVHGARPLSAIESRLRESLVEAAPLAGSIAALCVDEAPATLRQGGLIRDGVDAELDEARALQRDAGEWLADYQARLDEAHDLPGMKVGFNKVFGYYIELPAAQARRAPDAFTRKQTLKNAERYITPELKTFEEKVSTAEARALARERELFQRLLLEAAGCVRELQSLASAVAALDVSAGLAEKARRRGWVRPEVVDRPVLEIEAGRHPVLDETLGDRFVPNGVSLGGSDAHLSLITGPNMAGKSTFIRQVALLAVLASAGGFVPAERATIGVCDRIFTRVGADDALHRGQSTFMVEMAETAAILNGATPRSLVILDEIGRGTSTLDGLSLAWAIAERLGEPGAPRALFATHYHELTELAERDPASVKNLHVAARVWRDEIVFLHEIKPGAAEGSYGVHVAKLA